MPSVLSEIIEWGNGLPFWERAALDMIISGEEFTDEKYDELLDYLLLDNHLTKASTFPRRQLRFSQGLLTGEIPERGKPRLKKIYNLRNINALVSDQELEFCPTLTTIYGENGSGKSGYARVIGSAAFTRGDRQILRNITKPDTGETLSADIELLIDGEIINIHHEIGAACPEMRSFYVFDSTSVRAHLMHSNPMSFSPGGLIYLKRLADATDQVRRRLAALVELRIKENIFAPQFNGSTVISDQIANLGISTDIDELIRLSNVSDEEITKIDELDREIARLKAEDIPEKIDELKQTSGDLRELIQSIGDLSDVLSDSKVSEIQTRIKDWNELNHIAQSQSIEKFKISSFSQIGTPIWVGFALSAQKLAQSESPNYPQVDDLCLLCHQSLSSDAHKLIHDLWGLLESDIQERLTQLEDALAGYVQQLEEMDFEILDDQRVSYRHLAEQDHEVLETANAYIEALRKRFIDVSNAIRNKINIAPVAPLPSKGIEEIGRVIGHIEAETNVLLNRKTNEEITKLENQKTYFEHCKILKRNISEILNFVSDAKWVQNANATSVKRSTKHISIKYSDLFNRLVTDEYLRLFQETLKRLNCPLGVRVLTKVQKGETFKQIGLVTDQTVDSNKATPDKVLSEGEQRAVALADFLTEVALDEDSCGIILDDPVTSLDFQWKTRIASHIIEEATRQQVIVFTHDLHFLYVLSELAVEKDLELVSHWIEKFDETPGYVHLNNSPAVEAKYKTTRFVQELYKNANNPLLPPERRERLLKEGFGALRTCYEALVVFELFNGVVLRFDEQIKIGNLKDVVVNSMITKEIIDKVGDLSRFIEGHLHSDQFVAQKPTPKMLMDEMNEYDRIKKLIKDSRKTLL